jgi:regulator of protease activity HflC (stomatin/prohibitin superfamily)
MAPAPLSNTQERPGNSVSGGIMLLVLLALIVLAGWLLVDVINTSNPFSGIAMVVAFFLFVLVSSGFFTLQPNEAAALTLFGNYKGTERATGLRWVLPWFRRRKISLRVRNVTGQTLKVNDKRGNPIEIAAVVVWRVSDTARALFDVEAYQTFVDIQIETALRELASHFSYDHAEASEPTLRANADEVAQVLREKLQERVSVAGVSVDETKLSHLAYAPEIAGAMLRRQQAEAVIAARQLIVEGAVSMVENALQQLSARDIVKLDDERRAAMVSNLLVVLCADRDAQPVVNAGTIYQ